MGDGQKRYLAPVPASGASSLVGGGAGASGWALMHEQASALVKSGFLPNVVNTPEKAIAIILTGEELGIPKMLALRSIDIINGKPSLSADLMASLVQRAIDRKGDGEFRVLPPTATECTVHYRRWGWRESLAYTYTIEDAKRAGLAGKETWKAHPAAMLRARATSAVCKMAFSDVIAGLYAPEDIDEGDLLVHEAATAQAWPEAPAQSEEAIEARARVVESPERIDPAASESAATRAAGAEDGVDLNPDHVEGSREFVMLRKDELAVSDPEFNRLRRELRLGQVRTLNVAQCRALSEAMLNLASGGEGKGTPPGVGISAGAGIKRGDEDAGQGELPIEAGYRLDGEAGADQYTLK